MVSLIVKILPHSDQREWRRGRKSKTGAGTGPRQRPRTASNIMTFGIDVGTLALIRYHPIASRSNYDVFYPPIRSSERDHPSATIPVGVLSSYFVKKVSLFVVTLKNLRSLRKACRAQKSREQQKTNEKRSLHQIND
jgi:hypothetical protein